ncbi:sugar phosphate isomerase/epimerase family protein [Saliphagus infecundisoli]|uniref:Sugar phosphate isomerase/epimerase family protein n=1 Tax=Saliphagus infecundisoli TaxID=1849069 RepID=A0ABD5QI84_9EURY|nr:sugar phosphate isomerase/epimerase [Saliphagus infecundisoli]
MTRTAINLYSVRDLDESMLEILDRVAAAGYDGVQFSGGLRDTDPEDVVEKLSETGLETTGAHVDIDDLESDLAGSYDLYGDRLRCASAVVPYLGQERFESEAAVRETAERLSDLAADAEDYAWPIHYHNHAHEFVDVGGETFFERLADLAPEVGLELDVGWALVGGEDPVELIERYGDRIDLLHMKDMVTDEKRGFREIGDGDVDMAACAEAARKAEVEWLIYEHDEPEDPAASIETGATVLRSI